VLRFVKYEGLGNDFIILDRLAGGDGIDAATARALCDRHRGVGADGVLTLWSDSGADARMQLQNADGSESLISGNGLRCCARYLHDVGVVASERSDVAVRAGPSIYVCRRVSADVYRGAMGRPSDRHPDLPPAGSADEGIEVSGRVFEVTCLYFGNPHAVIFTDGQPLDLALAYGPELERHRLFRNRTNVTFARATGDGFEAVVHERGVGITEACGSGASALGAAAVRTDQWERGEPMTVRLPGGSLTVTVDADDTVALEGPAVRVFAGEVDS
jgi:diaminopimelate epimerase